MTTLQDHPDPSEPAARVFHDDDERVAHACPWHPLPEDAVVQLVAIERRAIRAHRAGSPIQPAQVIWSALIRRDGTTQERHDLPPAVYRALAGDGGERVRPMCEIRGRRLNAAVERARAAHGHATTTPTDPPGTE